MKQKDPHVYGLYWSTTATKQDQYDHYHGLIRLSIVVVNANAREEDKVTQIPDELRDQAFGGLELKCYWMNAEATPIWSTHYPAQYYIDLEDARRILKTLERVHAAYKRFPVQPQTFGQYATLLCREIGITKFCWRQDRETKVRDIGTAQTFIDSRIEEMRKPAAVPA